MTPIFAPLSKAGAFAALAAALALAWPAAAQDEQIGGPEAAARFRAERLDYLIEQATAGAQIAGEPVPEGAASAALARAARAARRGALHFLLLRQVACLREIVEPERCAALDPPAWIAESPEEVPSVAEIERRIDWIESHAADFIVAGCASGSTEIGEHPLEFCSAAVAD